MLPATVDDVHRIGSVVVVGAGLGGAQTVAALRAQGFDGRVTLVGREGRPPYDRPPLSKELFERDVPADLVDELGVDVRALADDVRLGVAATALAVRTDSVEVTLDDGAAVTADAVVLAVGSVPVVPPGWDDALVLHTWDDAVRLRSLLVPGARLVCVGAGWIGAEVAGAAAKAGCEVVVVEAASVPLERQLGVDVGRHLAPWYPAAGVSLRLGSAVTAVRGRPRPDGRRGAARVELASGEVLDGDVVLSAVGARPATAWLAGTLPADARGSLRGDAVGRVVPRVYAVGDCVTRHGSAFGDVPGGHWSAALHDPAPTVAALLADLGRPAGDAPTGTTDAPLERPGTAAPTHAPYVFSRQLGHDLSLFGAPSAGDEVVLRGLPGTGSGWTVLYAATDETDAAPTVRDPRVRRLTGVLVVDAHREVGAARKLLRDGFPLVDLAVATDPARPLRDAVVAGR